MLDIQALRNDLDGVVRQLQARGFEFDAAKFSAFRFHLYAKKIV